MKKILLKHFIMDRNRTRIYFQNYTEDGTMYDIIVLTEKFIQMFSAPLQKAMDNGTDPMDEIRAFDPENKLGYNNLIV